jgi:hypothetical protein
MIRNVTLQSPLSSRLSRFTDYTVQATTDSSSTASSTFRLPEPKSLVKVVIVLGYRTQLVRRVQLECDGTRTENRFRFSEKRASPFKLAGASVQSTTGSQSVRASK